MKNQRQLFSLVLSLPIVAGLLLLTAWPAQAQYSSPYYQAVTNLNPIAYLPLQETTQPPANDIETNLGSLGPVANAVYSSTHVTKGLTPRPIASEPSDTAVNCLGSAGGFLAVPTTDSRYSVQAPFSVETWVYPANYNHFVGLVSQSGGNPGRLNGGGLQGGWCLSAQYIAYY